MAKRTDRKPVVGDTVNFVPVPGQVRAAIIVKVDEGKGGRCSLAVLKEDHADIAMALVAGVVGGQAFNSIGKIMPGIAFDAGGRPGTWRFRAEDAGNND